MINDASRAVHSSHNTLNTHNTMTSDKDTWADLADSLGATPQPDATPASSTEKSAPRPPSPSAEKPAPAAPPPSAEQPAPTAPPPSVANPPKRSNEGGWDSLASELGIQPQNDTPNIQKHPAPEPTQHHDTRPKQTERPRQTEREPEKKEPDGWADNILPDETTKRDNENQDSSDTTDSGEKRERRGRRRRGRRGGRDRQARNRRDESGEMEQASEHRSSNQPREPLESDDRRVDSEIKDADQPPGKDGDVSSSEKNQSTEDGDQPRRRRRRGRRGGRRRSTRERLAGERQTAETPESEQRLADLDDEPLATSYGMPINNNDSSASEENQPENKSDDTAEGERRPRRRRRRRSSGESRPAPSNRETPRDGRRRRSDSSRSPSRSSRSRRRENFEPVAGKFEEDDEGVEFLGVDEAHSTPVTNKEDSSQDDNALAESGLDTVRDVPSWVEAIGMVIAPNLEARNKSSGNQK